MKRILFGAVLAALVLLIAYSVPLAQDKVRVNEFTCKADSASPTPTGTTYLYLTPKAGVTIDPSKGFEWWVHCTDSSGATVADTVTIILQATGYNGPQSGIWINVRGANDTIVLSGALGAKTALYYGTGSSARRITKGIGISYPPDTVAALNAAGLMSKIRLIIKGVGTATDSVFYDDMIWKTTVVQYAE